MSAPVEIRRYQDVAAFQEDAASMAAAGWHVVAQSESAGGMNGAWVALGVIVLIGSLLLFIPGVLLAVLIFILAAVDRRKMMVVTYRPRALG